MSFPVPSPHSNKNPLMKALVYGAPGSGKTSLAASAAKHPAMAGVLFLSVEGGMLSVPSNPKILSMELRNDATSAVSKLESVFWVLADPTRADKHPWVKEIRTVVIDSGTELLTLVLESLSSSRRGTKDDTTTLAEYGTATAQLKRLFRWFRDLPYHVIVTALSKGLFAGKEDKVLLGVEPAFTSKLGHSVMGTYDHVWYTYTSPDTEGAVGYYMNTQDSMLPVPSRGKTRGKAFSAAIGPVVQNPDLSVLYNVLVKTEGKA